MLLIQLLVRTIFLMTPPHVNVNISSPCIVGTVKVAELCQYWPRVFRQRMEPYSIRTKAQHLIERWLRQYSEFRVAKAFTGSTDTNSIRPSS